QRLVSLAVALRIMPGAEQAQSEIAHALDELRVIARGLYPAVLTDCGLAAAIEALAETARAPVVLGPLPDGRFDPVVESAAYFVVAAAAQHGPIAVSGVHERGQLALSIVTGAAEDLTLLEDRVGAA